MIQQLKKVIARQESKEVPALRIVDAEKRSSFYRISHPDKLAMVGASYLEDFRRGVKSFAISSTNYKTSQQRTILALASYFEQLFDLKILIVSDSLKKGAFGPLVDAGTREKISFIRPEIEAECVRFYHHFSFMDLEEIIRDNHYAKLQELIQDFDLILWDTPLLAQQHEAQRALMKISGFIESFSMIVPPSTSTQAGRDELRKHFAGFGININGVLFRELYKGND